MNINEKKILVKNLNAEFKNNSIILVAHYSGLNVSQINNLRSSAKQHDVTVKVVKNSLAKLAVEGTDFSDLKDDLSGPTLLIFASDIVAAAKILVEFAKKNEELVVKAGSYNKSNISKDEIINISKMPTLDEIRAKLISLINAPATKIACVLKAPASNCIGVLKAYANK
jgi:large subunit ribosomal protein L10